LHVLQREHGFNRKQIAKAIGYSLPQTYTFMHSAKLGKRQEMKIQKNLIDWSCKINDLIIDMCAKTRK
jgi:hypothetical protein